MDKELENDISKGYLFFSSNAGLEVKNYDEEREFIFNETDKEIFLNLRRKPKLKNAHKKVEKGKPIWYNYL